VVNGGESFDFTILNEDDNLEFSYTATNGENCALPCGNFTLNPNDYSVFYYFVLNDTASGCTISDTLRLDVEFSSELNVPNIFTPNGDGQNDIYRAYGKDIFEYSLMIFDRWGGKMFETTELSEGWDGNFKGQPVQSGVYLGIIEATGLDAKKYKLSINIKLVR
jgi:gliding motility-associated-like protein